MTHTFYFKKRILYIFIKAKSIRFAIIGNGIKYFEIGYKTLYYKL